MAGDSYLLIGAGVGAAGAIGMYVKMRHWEKKTRLSTEAEERSGGTHIPNSERGYASELYHMVSRTITDLGDGRPHGFQTVREIVEETADMYSFYLRDRHRMHDLRRDKELEVEIFLKKHGVSLEDVTSRNVVYE